MDLFSSISRYHIGKFGVKSLLRHPFIAIAAGAAYLWYRNHNKGKANAGMSAGVTSRRVVSGAAKGSFADGIAV